jgi:hypothetical protein
VLNSLNSADAFANEAVVHTLDGLVGAGDRAYKADALSVQVGLPSVTRILGPKATFVRCSGDEIECQTFNDGRKARGFERARNSAVTLSRNCDAKSGKC